MNCSLCGRDHAVQGTVKHELDEDDPRTEDGTTHLEVPLVQCPDVKRRTIVAGVALDPVPPKRPEA